MGEIFESAKSALPLPWTGERLTQGAGPQVEIEHLHRYLLARALCRDLDVLDIASGEGYGSFYLSQVARSVVGVEISQEAVNHACAAYATVNLRFLQGDARRIPLDNASVDAVVSFETLEHFYEQKTFIAEIKRVLRPGGRLIVSSPDRDTYSPAQQPPNPYHVQELSQEELLRLLRGTFAHVVLQRQRTLIGSALMTDVPIGGPGARSLTFERRGADRFEASDGLPRAMYLLAVAADAPVAVPDSLFVETGLIEPALLELPRLREQTSAHKRCLAEYERQLAEFQALRGEQDVVLREMEAHNRKLEASTRRVESEYEALQDYTRLLETTAAVSKQQAAARVAAAQGRQAAVERLGVEREQVWEARLSHIEAQRAEVEQHLALVETELAATIRRMAQAEALRDQVLHSTVWKAFYPVRRLLESRPGLRRGVRRSLKLAWYAARLQPGRIVAGLRQPLPALATPAPTEAAVIAPDLQALAGEVPPTAPVVVVELPSAKALEADAPPPEPDSSKATLTQLANAELKLFLASDERIVFRRSGPPDISVVIILWNAAHLTLRCLRALQAQVGPAFEVVLFDNGSTDDTARLLDRVDGTLTIHNVGNAGFVVGCNRGVAASTGRTVLLLNNDAFLRPGALSASLQTLDRTSDAGAVGGRIILADGSLQEVGSVIWSDGSTVGVGRGMQPNASVAMFRRDVDYCSGAFMLTPRRIWDQLRGFDECFSPAYFEEADYCMRLRAAGLRVIYEPMAVIDHFEFGSQAPGSQAVSLQIRNRKLFRARHFEALHQHHLPNARETLLIARARLQPGQRRLLLIDDEVPFGISGSGYVRTRELLYAATCNGWFVTMYASKRLTIDWRAVRQEIPWEIEIVTGLDAPPLLQFMAERLGYYDVLMVSKPNNMADLRVIAQNYPHLLYGMRLVYDAGALFTAQKVIQARLAGQPISEAEAERRLNEEIELADVADVVSCVSKPEAQAFRARLDKPVRVLAYPGVVRRETPGFDKRFGLLFVGRLLETVAPNWQGLAWFIRTVWPLVRTALPEVTLTIIGQLHAEHAELWAPGVQLLGSQNDLGLAFDHARVFVAPIQFAAGLPLKVLDASFAGVPCAGTLLMVEQMEWQPGVHMVAADDPEELAVEIIRLHEDRNAWTAMRDAAYASINERFNSTVFQTALQSLLDEPA